MMTMMMEKVTFDNGFSGFSGLIPSEKCMLNRGWSITRKEKPMEALKNFARKYAKNKWLWILLVAIAGLLSDEVFLGGKFSQVLLIILGQG